MSAEKQPLKKFLIPIFLIVAADIMGFTMIFPLLPFYAEHFGATPLVVGLLTAVFALCQFLAGPTLGRLSDRFGRKPVLMVSQIGTFIGFLILAKANVLWLVFLARIIDGITAGNLTVAQAYISDVTEPKDRTRYFGVIGIAFGLGFFIGPAVTGYLSRYGVQYPAYAAAGFSAISILSTWFMLPRTDTHYNAGQSQQRGSLLARLFDYHLLINCFKQPKLRNALLQFTFFNLSFSFYVSGFAMFAERQLVWGDKPFGPTEVGYVFSYLGFIGIFIQGYLLGKMVKAWGDEKVARIGFVTQGIGYSFLGFTSKLFSYLPIATLGSFGSGLTRPATTSLISQHANPGEQGMVIGLSQSLASVSAIVAPLIAGTLIELGYLKVWSFSAGGLALLGLLF